MSIGPALGRTAALAAFIAAAVPRADAAGALAIGSCDRHGYAYDYATLDAARTRALVECASQGDRSCHIVSETAGGCAAFAISGNCGPRGWSSASSRAEAEGVALDYCRRYGGAHCRVRRWVCDSGN